MNAAYEYMDETSIDPELICNICQEPFRDPCCVPCGEIYCRECISRWIQAQKGSCPHCRQTMSIKSLNKIPRSLQNMLDRLQVKCITCGQTDLKRIDFDDHIQKMCPNTIVSCPSENSKCSWRGQRGQINLHLIDCRFLPMKPIITQLMVENQQLKDQVNQLTSQTDEQQSENQQLKDQVNQLTSQTDEQQSENQQLKDQVSQLTNQTAEQQSENQRLKDQVNQLTNQTTEHQSENQQLKDQVSQLTNQTIEQQNKNQRLKNRVNQLKNQTAEQQSKNQQLKEQVNQLTSQTDEQQSENQQLKDQVSQLTNRTIEQQNENQRLKNQVNLQTIQLSEQRIELRQHKEQNIQPRTEILEHQNGNQQLHERIAQLKTRVNKSQPENQQLKQKDNQTTSMTIQSVQLDCGGHSCPKYLKCGDWYDPGFFSPYAKRDGATCRYGIVVSFLNLLVDNDDGGGGDLSVIYHICRCEDKNGK